MREEEVLAKGKKELQEGIKELDEREIKLLEGNQQLEQNREELQKASEEFEKSKKESNEKGNATAAKLQEMLKKVRKEIGGEQELTAEIEGVEVKTNYNERKRA